MPGLSSAGPPAWPLEPPDSGSARRRRPPVTTARRARGSAHRPTPSRRPAAGRAGAASPRALPGVPPPAPGIPARRPAEPSEAPPSARRTGGPEDRLRRAVRTAESPAGPPLRPAPGRRRDPARPPRGRRAARGRGGPLSPGPGRAQTETWGTREPRGFPKYVKPVGPPALVPTPATGVGGLPAASGDPAPLHVGQPSPKGPTCRTWSLPACSFCLLVRSLR